MQELSEHRLMNILEIAIGLIVSAVIIYFTIVSLGKLNLSQLLSEKLNWWLAGISALVFGLSSLARGFVYTYGIDKEIHWFNAWRITAVGNAANMVTPLRMGEGLRLALFPRGYKAGKRARLIIIPAIADIAVILLLSIIAVWLAGFNDPQILKVLTIVSIIFFIVGSVIVVILLIIPRTKKIVKNNFNKHTLFMTMWILISWLLVLLSIYLGFLCLGFDFILSIRYSLASFVCMNIVTFIPSSPGNIGLFEGSVLFALTIMGVSDDLAKVVGLLLHCIQYAIMLPLGLVLLLAGLHKHIRKLRRRRKTNIF